MKKTLLALAVTLLLSVTTACSGGEVEWSGTFYNYLKDDHALVLTFEHDGSGEGFYGAATEIMTDNGISKTEVSLNAEITKKNIAEDGRGYRYTLKGDTLTVQYVDDDENIGTDFSGTYKRGAPIEETFDLEVEDDIAPDSTDSSSTPIAIVPSDYYYKDGTVGDISLYFYDDGEVDVDYPDGTTETYDYELDGSKIILYEDEAEALILVIIDPYTLEYEDGGYQFIIP